jgi:hypothetical protein
MATVKEITHDSSLVLADFYSTITDADGGMSVSAAAALGGSVNGVSIDFDAGTQTMRLEESFVISSNEIRWRTRIDLGGITNNNAGVEVLSGGLLTAGSLQRLSYSITANAGDSGFEIQFSYRDDTGATVFPSTTMPSSGDTCLDIRYIKETADGNNDGIIETFINGTSNDLSSTLENFNSFTDIAKVRMTFRSLSVNYSGSCKYDEFIITDVAGVSLCVAALTLAAMTKPADIDAAGEFIYVALLEGGTPIVTKISTALDADGTTVFNPGAGDNIGVECGRFDADVIWVAGNFDGTNVVEKSEDGGSSFVVKDNGAIGDIRAFVMGPDSDDKILIFDETNGDILETRDNGASWTTINASVTPEVNAIARLGKNVQESVFGNDGGANNSINYSVNSGDDLEDFQTGVYPNANATRVIVN